MPRDVQTFCRLKYFRCAWAIAWESSRHFATPPLVSPRNDFWETSAEIPYRWRVITQIWVVLLIGLKQISHVARPIRSITQIWVVPHLQYEISALVFQPSFRKGTSGGITKWRLFFQATRAKENPFFQPVFEVCKTKVYCYPTLLVGSLVHCRVASSSVYRLHRFIHLGEERLWPQKIPINGSKFEVWC